MQICTIAGNLGKDAELKSTQQGDKLAAFSVAVSTGWGERKATTWWDVTVWGKRGESLAPHLTKGAKITVSGEMSTREYEGKTYLQLRADHVALQGGKSDSGYEPRQTPTGRVADGSRGSVYHAPADDELDDSVPFLTMQGAW